MALLSFKAVNSMTDIDAVSIWAVCFISMWNMAMWAFFGEGDDDE